MTINCTANQVENLFAPPIIIWRDPNGRDVPTGESSNPRMDPITRQLIFNDITEANSGLYECRAVVSIDEAQIENLIDMETVIVSTDCEHFTYTVFYI